MKTLSTSVSGVLLLIMAVFCAPVSAEVTVTDSQQRQVTLAQPAKRIVALAPHIVENSFSAGAGEHLVGVVSYSDFPPQASDIKVVGDYKSWSLEAIVALQPDLILMWGTGNGMGSVASLARLGIPVYVSEPRNLSDISATIRDIGKLAGTEQVSEPEAARIERDFDDLAAEYQDRHRLSVLYQVWNEPLQTVNGEHLISRVLELCGAQNVFADAAPLAPTISVESVLYRNPDAIVASGMGQARPQWLDQWRQYPALTASKNNALLFVNPDHIQRPTARILLGARELCAQLETIRGSGSQLMD